MQQNPIFYHCHKLQIEAKKIDNVSYLTHAEAEAIKQRINKNNKQTKNKRATEQSEENNSNNTNQSELVKLLTEQLSVKDNQIKQLNNTLNEQQRLLHNQQTLALQSSAKIEQLETELNEARLSLNSKSDVQKFNSDLVADKVKSDVPNIKKETGMIKNLLTIFRFVLKQ
ncbi:DUF536 domain-containing protein [Macrococcoides caseolyticum]|uniref:DUF536 domain-containing protein n=1 Tax=Macrococcoides caseolyticum TaxID=69966 RepID=UPI0012FF2552|nr:DUF536 domain-containing protein [Macrococcus caseolyticus]